MAGFSYIWEFRVKPQHLAEFEAAYGPEGDWLRLFRTDPGYLGTELLRDREDPFRFITVDHWTSREACRAFRERCRPEYEALDGRCAGFTASERHLGDFDTV